MQMSSFYSSATRHNLDRRELLELQMQQESVPGL